MLFEDKNRIPVVKVSRRPSTKTFFNSRCSSETTNMDSRLYSNTTADPQRIVMNSPEGALNPLFAGGMVPHGLERGESFYHNRVENRPVRAPVGIQDSESDDSWSPYD